MQAENDSAQIAKKAKVARCANLSCLLAAADGTRW